MASLADSTDTSKSLGSVVGITPNSRRYKFLHHLENVGVPVIIVKTILAPIERWRIIRQTWNSYITNSKPYTGFVDYFQRTLKNQGVSSLWRGNTANWMVYLVQMMCQFGFYENVNNFWNWQTDSRIESEVAYIGKLLSVAALTSLFTYPFEVAKIRMSMEFYKKREYHHARGALDAINLIRKKQGFRGLYKGYTLGVVTSLIYFVTFSELTKNLQTEAEALPKEFSLTALTSLIASLSIYPLDTLKYTSKHKGTDFSSIIMARHLLAQIGKQNSSLFEAVRSTYRGVIPFTIKHVLLYAITIELIKTKQKFDLNYL